MALPRASWLDKQCGEILGVQLQFQSPILCVCILHANADAAAWDIVPKPSHTSVHDAGHLGSAAEANACVTHLTSKSGTNFEKWDECVTSVCACQRRHFPRTDMQLTHSVNRCYIAAIITGKLLDLLQEEMCGHRPGYTFEKAERWKKQLARQAKEDKKKADQLQAGATPAIQPMKDAHRFMGA
eukprot:364792-Chlamydomonas_euryale.AAC.23